MLVARQTRLGQARLIRKLILAPVCNAWPCKNPHQRWQVPTRACLSQTGAGGTCHLWCGFLDGQATQDLPSFVLVCKVFLTPFRCWCPHVKPPERSSYVAPVATSVLKASSLASLLTRSPCPGIQPPPPWGSTWWRGMSARSRLWPGRRGPAAGRCCHCWGGGFWGWRPPGVPWGSYTEPCCIRGRGLWSAAIHIYCFSTVTRCDTLVTRL